MTDHELLQAYAKDRSESAFAQLVERHMDLVYSAALRQAGESHLAEDVAQAVFLTLARKAGSLGKGVHLPGWLMQTARYAAANALEQRRRQMRHERLAAEAARQGKDAKGTWAEVAPLLDSALASLRSQDRKAMIMRYFEEKSVSEVAKELAVSEEVAYKRFASCLEKLRGFFRRRGIAVPAGILTGLLTSEAVLAAPSGLAATTAAAVLSMAKGTALAGSSAAISKGVLKMMFWAKVKTAAVVTVAVLAVGGAAAPAVIHMVGSSQEPPSPAIAAAPPSPEVPVVLDKSEAGEGLPEQSVKIIDINGFECNNRLSLGDPVHFGSYQNRGFRGIYTGGKFLRAQLNGQCIEVAVDGGLPRLAGFALNTPEDLPELGNILSEEPGPIAVWCLCSVLEKLPELPHSEKIAYLELGGGCRINDPNALARLVNLQVLEVRDFDLQDLSPIAALQKLKTLSFYILYTPIDLSPLKELRNLQWLNMSFYRAPEVDLSVLENLIRLHYLQCSIEGVGAKDFNFLSRLTNLRELDLSQSNISDLSPLANLRHLRKLRLWNTPVSDLTLLQGITSLEEIDLGHYQMGLEKLPPFSPIDLSPLENLPNLKRLNMMPGTTDNFAPLRKMKRLENITGVEDIDILKEMTWLKAISLSGPIADLSWLRNFHNLTALTLQNTSLPDLT
ncbi:MAG: sigma-70 family RNA polymerase sigma factor, partial [Planctomycetota bacterium]